MTDTASEGAIAPEVLRAMLERGANVRLVDVREPHEHDLVTIEGAECIPLARIDGIEHDESRAVMVVFCASGDRSSVALVRLLERGLVNVAHLEGGIDAWRGVGGPLVHPAPLTDDSRTRYRPQLALPEIGASGQFRLGSARVLVIGAGGLGCPASLYLAGAGVGTIGIVDGDRVDRGNLQRQIGHTDARTGSSKVASLRATLTALNPTIAIETYDVRLASSTACDLVSRYDVIVDASDNFETHELVNDWAVELGRPAVMGTVRRDEGRLLTVVPDGATARTGRAAGPCWRCLYPSASSDSFDEACADVGVLGPICGVVGSLQAAEVIKLLTQAGDIASGKLLTFTAFDLGVRAIRFERDPECPTCGERSHAR